MSLSVHLARILELLPDARRSGQGWSARCPAHPDRHASLGVTISDDDRQRVNLHCFAGCEGDAVLVALSLSVADLYPDHSRRGTGVLREHRYHDAYGTVVYAVRRLNRASSKFLTFHPTATGWASTRGGARPVLYRLPSLLAEPDMPVVICEGERDADKLATSCGLLTTTVASGSWEGVDTSTLAGRAVFVVVDNDRKGWARGAETLAVAQRAGALIEQVWRPPDRFKDAAEMVGHGDACEDFISVDLATDEPPCEVWHTDIVDPAPPRQADDEAGLAFGVRTPGGVILHFVQAGQLDGNALLVWVLLEDRAGKSGIAHLTAAEIHRVLRIDEHRAANAIKALAACGLIAVERRGRIRVFNPAHHGRRGSVPRGLTYVNRDNTPHSLPPRPPNTSPGNRAETAVRHTEIRGSSSGDPRLDRGSSSGDDATPDPRKEHHR